MTKRILELVGFVSAGGETFDKFESADNAIVDKANDREFPAAEEIVLGPMVGGAVAVDVGFWQAPRRIAV
ncbi:hypothetical protein [Crateriforma spongiae]|uniref:hypothetical protein n=1 Tax=Crateriforma spongiae TaxID=2724528 RepID=UPI0014472EC1|nr:hypothetical protein [Crateriforma spongiae]